MRLVLVDPPGTGKDIQTAILSEKFGVPHISTGDLSRTNIGEGTPLGIRVKSYIDAGNLAPDDVTVRVVELRLNKDDAAKGLLPDNFPCAAGQAEELKCLPSNLGTELNAVIQFDVSEDIVVKRMLVRGRADDTEEVIHNCMHVYTNKTAPLLDYYSERIVKIAAGGSVEEINERMMTKPEKLNQAPGVPVIGALAFFRWSGRWV